MNGICVTYNARSIKAEEDETGCSYYTKKCNYEILGTKTVLFGLKSRPKIWKLKPNKLKVLKSLESFKKTCQKFEIWEMSLANYVKIIFTVSDVLSKIS